MFSFIIHNYDKFFIIRKIVNECFIIIVIFLIRLGRFGVKLDISINGRCVLCI